MADYVILASWCGFFAALMLLIGRKPKPEADEDLPPNAHVTDDTDCWCEPKVEQPCPTCRGREGNFACRTCGGEGWCDRWNDNDPCLVTHRVNRIRR